jgi:DNA repair protein RadC
MNFTAYDIVSTRKRKLITIKVPTDIVSALTRYTHAKQEQFIVVTLNSAHNVIAIHIATTGLVGRTIVHPREVFYHAIHDMASSIIVCHNHPSGQLIPSNEDLEITKRLIEAAEVLGIRFLDHIIISKSGYKSLRQDGVMDSLKSTDDMEDSNAQ